MHQKATSSSSISFPLPLSAGEASSPPSLRVVPETRELSQSLCDASVSMVDTQDLPDGAIAVSVGSGGVTSGAGGISVCCGECRPIAKVRASKGVSRRVVHLVGKVQLAAVQ
jgi:hypothetical protein